MSELWSLTTTSPFLQAVVWFCLSLFCSAVTCAVLEYKNANLRLHRQARYEQGYKVVKFNKKRKQTSDVCAICLEEFAHKVQVAVCPCTHMFHMTCLIDWLQHQNNCPMCKAAVQPIDERTGLVEPSV